MLESLTKNAQSWERRGQLAARKECPILREGAIAYAAKQEDLQKKLRQRFSEVWTNTGLAHNNQVDNDQGNGFDAATGLYTIAQDDSDAENGIGLKGGDSDDDL